MEAANTLSRDIKSISNVLLLCVRGRRITILDIWEQCDLPKTRLDATLKNLLTAGEIRLIGCDDPWEITAKTPYVDVCGVKRYFVYRV